MLKYAALLVSLSMGSMMFACSSDDEGDGEGSGGMGNAGPILNPVAGGTTGNSGIADQNGGTRDLTEDQVTTIRTAACAGWQTTGEPLPAVLMLVVDVSGSMNEQPPNAGNNSPTKWEITRDALGDAIGGLPAASAVGVLYYPNGDTPENETPGDTSECINTDEMIEVGLLTPMHRQDVLNSLDDANAANYTPTHDAYAWGLNEGLIPFSSSAPKFMLLITDGAPTMSQGCVRGGMTEDMPTAPIIAEVTAARAQGIKSFIIGAPGSEQSEESNTDMRPWLSNAALEGGTGTPGCQPNGPDFCHMDMTQSTDFAADLAAGLGAVAAQIATCTYEVADPPAGQMIDRSKINLIVHSNGGSTLVLPDGQGECTEGWNFDGDGNVVLCPATCEAVQADATANVELFFGCGITDIPGIF